MFTSNDIKIGTVLGFRDSSATMSVTDIDSIYTKVKKTGGREFSVRTNTILRDLNRGF